MNYGDREKSALPDSPIEPYIASWKERRTYALLQAAAVIYANGLPIQHAADKAEELLSEIESHLPESTE